MASFSSRGPDGDFIKPDVTAPGLQILAGNTPTPWPGTSSPARPASSSRSIAGTSMSSPHAAGVSALIKAAHPDWTPGQIKSAMMTSSVQSVVKEDGTTPADPFDRGAGSIRADRAVDAPVTFDVPAEDYVAAVQATPLHRVDLNVPSIDATTMPGEIETTRTMKNVSGRRLVIGPSTQAPDGAEITVTPSRVVLEPDQSRTVAIDILGKDLATNKQYFGQVTFHPDGHGLPDAVLPVAFFKKQGDGRADPQCDATSLARRRHRALRGDRPEHEPGRRARHHLADGRRPAGAADPERHAAGVPDERRLPLDAARCRSRPRRRSPRSRRAARRPAFLPLSLFGITPIAGVGDETIVNFDVPAFKFGSEEYSKAGADLGRLRGRGRRRQPPTSTSSRRRSRTRRGRTTSSPRTGRTSTRAPAAASASAS